MVCAMWVSPQKLLACFSSVFILGHVNFNSGHWKNNSKALLYEGLNVPGSEAHDALCAMPI